jgi:hypothetical protein
VTSGSLPSALTLESGVIRGRVSAGGYIATFTVQVTDSTGDTATRVMQIRVKNFPRCYSCHTSAGL